MITEKIYSMYHSLSKFKTEAYVNCATNPHISKHRINIEKVINVVFFFFPLENLHVAVPADQFLSFV